MKNVAAQRAAVFMTFDSRTYERLHAFLKKVAAHCVVRRYLGHLFCGDAVMNQSRTTVLTLI